jgi:hypothetical protein
MMEEADAIAEHRKWMDAFDTRLLIETGGDLPAVQAKGGSVGMNSLLHYVVNSSTFKEEGMRFASKFVRRRIRAKNMQLRDGQLAEFVRSTAGIPGMARDRGYFFEPFMHTAISRGGKFTRRHPDSYNTEEVELPPRTYQYFSKPDEINKLRDKTDLYLRPKSDTFPTIDSLSPPVTLFQGTINPNHTVNRGGYNDVLHRLKAKPEDVTLYIATPRDTFDKFQKPMAWEPKSTDAPAPNQWVLSIPLDAVDMKLTDDASDDDNDDAKMDDSTSSSPSSAPMSVGKCCDCKPKCKCKTKRCGCKSDKKYCTNCPSVLCENFE